MRYSKDEPEHPDDARDGFWSRARLEAMDARFVERVTRAIARGKERPGPEPVLLPGAMTTDQTSSSRAAGKSKENCS